MANPFDQFDPPTQPTSAAKRNANPFDQFDSGKTVMLTLPASAAASQSTQPPAASSQEPAPPLWQMPLLALGNLPSSAGQAIENVYSAVRHPIKTGVALYKTGAGEIDKASRYVDQTEHDLVDPSVKVPAVQPNEKYADAFNQGMANRYGGYDAIKRTLATDPVGAAMDASVLFGGAEGALGRLPGVAGKVGETAGDISRVINPVNAAAKGVGLVAKGAAKVVPKIPAAAPTIDALKAAARTAYATANASGIAIKSDALQGMVDSLQSDLQAKGIDPTLHPGATVALKRLQAAAASGQDVSLQDLDTLRRVAGQAVQASGQNMADKFMARVVQDHIDDFVDNLDQNSVSGTLDPNATAALSQARDYWARASKGEIIQRAFDKAANRPQTQPLAMALRTQFRNIANNQRAMARFSPQEQAAIKLVVQGGPVEKVLRGAGLFSPTSLTGIAKATVGGGIASLIGTPAAGVAVPVVGAAGDLLARALTSRNAARASELVRGAPLPGATATPTRLSIGLSGLGNAASNLATSPVARIAPVASEAGITQMLNENALARARGLPLPYPHLQTPLPVGLGAPLIASGQSQQIGP